MTGVFRISVEIILPEFFFTSVMFVFRFEEQVQVRAADRLPLKMGN